MKNISLIGMMGAGKTYIGDILGSKFKNFTSVDTDSLVEYHFNMSIPEIFNQKGEDFFRDAETHVIKMACERKNLIISLGGGAFEREENRKILKETSTVVYLETSPKTIYERIKNCKNRPLLKEGFDEDKITQILKKREKNYKLADFIISTDKKSVDEIVEEISKVIND